jgi:SAM-dependent methyltransferase
VGCNTGSLLHAAAGFHPSLKLSGVDVNPAAVAAAGKWMPHADIRLVRGSALPFADESFDCVTCIEVIEHIPSSERKRSLSEMCRVLAPGGRLVVRCPHAGLFAFLDAANFRYRFPWLYRNVIGRGRRDQAYPGGSAEVVWHQHFSVDELRSLMPDELELEHVRFGGLFLFPLSDLLRWPFYRAERTENFIVRALAGIAEMDYGIDYGRASFGILMAMRKRI